LKSERVQNTKV